MEAEYYDAKNNNELSNDLCTLLGTRGLEIGGKCQVFDGQAWMKKGDIGNNECYYVDATILSVGRTEYNEIIVDVKMTDGRLSHGHYLEGVRSHCA